VASGRIANFENYKVTTKTNRYGQRIKPSDFPVTDDLFKRLQIIHRARSVWKSILPEPEAESRFIKTRLRYNLITAAFGSVSANQVLTEQDTQVARAIEFLPRAQQLNLAASRTKRHK
jgi:carboxyl-terminal processing protease